MDDALFDAAPFTVEPAETMPAETLSADRRRTLRQAKAVSRGIHPLALVFGQAVRMHPDADRAAAATDAKNLPLRCGSCWHRELMSAGGRDVPKCGYRDENSTDQQRHHGGPKFASHSVATDCRSWWPACTYYTPGDTSVSPDAARYIPELTNA